MPRSRTLALIITLSCALLVLSACSDSSSPPTSETVTLHVFAEGSLPIPTSADWAAFQDGDGAWTVLAPAAAGVYTATVTDAQGRFGFALYANGDLHLQHGTVAECADPVTYLDTGLSRAKRSMDMGSMDKRAMIPIPGYYGIHGSIGYDFTPGESVVAMGRSSSSSTPIASYWFTVKAGLHDLVISDNGWGETRLMNWLYMERGLDVQSETTHNVSVAAAQRILLEDGASLQVTGDASNTSVTIGLLTANGTYAMLAGYDVVPGAATAFRSVPAAAMVSGDRYEVELGRGSLRKWACFGSATGMTTSVPSGDFLTFSVAAVDAGSARYPIFSGLSMSGGKGYFIYCGAGLYFTDAVISSGWLAANTATTYQVPNLTSLAGWQAGWSLPSGTAITDQDAVFFNGNVALPNCVRHHFSEPNAPLAAGEWVSTAWRSRP
jgi:hypothetical protein